MERQLGVLGCEVVVVASGEDALRMSEAELRIDVVLTELRLPDLDGRELAWALGRKRPFVRVAFMGCDAPREPLESPFLKKPFTTDALSRAIAEAMPARRAIR